MDSSPKNITYVLASFTHPTHQCLALKKYLKCFTENHTGLEVHGSE